MTSLFSSFDCRFFYAQLFILVLRAFFIFNFFIKISSRLNFLHKFSSLIEKFFIRIKPRFFNKFFCYLILRIIIFIFFLNFLGVLPYNFSPTSQVRVLILFSLGLWLGLFSFFASSNFKGLSSHIIPEGTPIFLTWFLFIIELVRNIIRPITLIVRLLANILAGHLLIILLFKLVLTINLIFIGYIFLNLVELFVALIQSYIFATILCMYYSELE